MKKIEYLWMTRMTGSCNMNGSSSGLFNHLIDNAPEDYRDFQRDVNLYGVYDGPSLFIRIPKDGTDYTFVGFVEARMPM